MSDNGILPEGAAQHDSAAQHDNARLPEASIDPADIQVLTPMRRGDTGANALNLLLQEALNPYGTRIAGTNFRIGDRVMQIRNNYEKFVFNGDIGSVSGVEAGEVTVRFDDRLVAYETSELDELVLAYATTIHKAQGAGATRS